MCGGYETKPSPDPNFCPSCLPLPSSCCPPKPNPDPVSIHNNYIAFYRSYKGVKNCESPSHVCLVHPDLITTTSAPATTDPSKPLAEPRKSIDEMWQAENGVGSFVPAVIVNFTSWNSGTSSVLFPERRNYRIDPMHTNHPEKDNGPSSSGEKHVAPQMITILQPTSTDIKEQGEMSEFGKALENQAGRFKELLASGTPTCTSDSRRHSGGCSKLTDLSRRLEVALPQWHNVVLSKAATRQRMTCKSFQIDYQQLTKLPDEKTQWTECSKAVGAAALLAYQKYKEDVEKSAKEKGTK